MWLVLPGSLSMVAGECRGTTAARCGPAMPTRPACCRARTPQTSPCWLAGMADKRCDCSARPGIPPPHAAVVAPSTDQFSMHAFTVVHASSNHLCKSPARPLDRTPIHASASDLPPICSSARQSVHLSAYVCLIICQRSHACARVCCVWPHQSCRRGASLVRVFSPGQEN